MATVRVLVVDDEQMVRSLVCRALKKTAMAVFEFVEARDGQEALERFDPAEIDMVLMDWNMPRMSGRDCAERMRRVPGAEATPIVMITSEGSLGKMMEAADQAGVTAYVVKPFTATELEQKIRPLLDLLEHRRKKRAAPANPGLLGRLLGS